MSKIRIKEELWDQVELTIKEGKASAYKMAVLEADKILNNILTLKGIPGATTQERALKIKEKFSSLTGLMRAFVLKEKILDHLSYSITSVEINDALDSYRQAIVDIDTEGKFIPFKEKIKLYFEYYIPKELKKLKNLALTILAFLAVILILADTGIGQDVAAFFVNIARFFYYKIVKIALIAGVVLGVIFFSFMYFEHKNKK